MLAKISTSTQKHEIAVNVTGTRSSRTLKANKLPLQIKSFDNTKIKNKKKSTNLYKLILSGKVSIHGNHESTISIYNKLNPTILEVPD